MILKVQRCQRQQPLGDQSLSLSLVNCFGPAQIYISVWLVPRAMVSSAICSPSPSGTSLAPFHVALGEVHQHCYARLLSLCYIHCAILVSGARYRSISIYYAYKLICIRRLVSSRTTPHRANQIGRLSLIVVVEALLSTVGPSFTCWVGAASIKRLMERTI